MIRLILLVTIIYSTLSYAKDKQGCEMELEAESAAKRTSISTSARESSLPSSIVVAVDEESSLRIFDEAIHRVSDGELLARALEIIERLARGAKDTKVSSKEYRLLKAARKQLVILRSTYIVFSRDHALPKKLHAFTREFGDLNDLVRLRGEEYYREMSQAVIDAFADFDFDELEASFVPASGESVREFLRSYADKMEKIVAKEKLSHGKHHTLRKRIRDFLTYFRGMVREEQDDEDLRMTVDYLFVLCDEMDAARKTCLFVSTKGKIVSRGRRPNLSSGTARDIRLFLERIRL